MKKKNTGSIFGLFNSIYAKIFNINDTPQRIALGLGLGVFLGIIPGAGPIASLFLASIFRLNRASALLGSLLTNTWISVITFLLSVKIGSAILKIQWQDIYYDWVVFLKDFHWPDIFKVSALKVALPVMLGYFIVGLAMGLFAYLTSLTALIMIRRRDKNRNEMIPP